MTVRQSSADRDHLDTAMISAASVGKKRSTSTRKGQNADDLFDQAWKAGISR